MTTPDTLVTAAAEALCDAERHGRRSPGGCSTCTARSRVVLAAAVAALVKSDEVDPPLNNLNSPDYYLGWDDCLDRIARMGES